MYTPLGTQGGIPTVIHPGRHTHRYTPRKHTPYIPTLGGIPRIYPPWEACTPHYTPREACTPHYTPREAYLRIYTTREAYPRIYTTREAMYTSFTPREAMYTSFTPREAIPLYIPPGRLYPCIYHQGGYATPYVHPGRLCYTLCTPREAYTRVRRDMRP